MLGAGIWGLAGVLAGAHSLIIGLGVACICNRRVYLRTLFQLTFCLAIVVVALALSAGAIIFERYAVICLSELSILGWAGLAGWKLIKQRWFAFAAGAIGLSALPALAHYGFTQLAPANREISQILFSGVVSLAAGIWVSSLKAGGHGWLRKQWLKSLAVLRRAQRSSSIVEA